ncbi:hypothetical protein Q8A67_006162 [Cirrhinus molitorella]|uniref:Immunoglobulin domain-containing protein n=1 Tax=Cirrhinus molitorella TaxID=172907 RepID=A0AA88TSH8_9TELE|nr:hypothetical protein Q8A67_006162 [Cirrhinus molitorella]
MNSVFLFLSLLIFTNGVFGDETEDVSVMEGGSVTLRTGVEKQKDDLIVWSFGPENILLAKVNGKANSMRIYDSIAGRGELDSQTGSLTITNINTTDSGLYFLKITNKNKVSYKTINVAVSESVTLHDSNSSQIEHMGTDEPCQTGSCLEIKRFPIMFTVVTSLVVFLIIIVFIRKRTGGYQKAPLMNIGHSEKHTIQEQV